jgi:hypothetical protein
MGTGSFPGVKSGRGVTLTPHPLLVPWSRKSRAIPLPPPPMAHTACTEPQCLYKGALYLFCTIKFNKINNVQKTSAVYHKSHKFLKNLGANRSLKQQNGNMNQVLYWWPTNIWCKCTKFSLLGDVVPRIFEPTAIYNRKETFKSKDYTIMLLTWSHQHLLKLGRWCSSVYSRTSNITDNTVHNHQSLRITVLSHQPKKCVATNKSSLSCNADVALFTRYHLILPLTTHTK